MRRLMSWRLVLLMGFISGQVAGLPVAGPGGAAEAAACTHYASPGGTGNGLTQTSPFKVQNFWAIAGPGKTLCLLDGIYQGEASMIRPMSGLSGVSGNPITVRAVNDGQVLIDGEHVRRPVHLDGNAWFVLEGFNAKRGLLQVINLQYGASNNIIRRVVAWDANASTNNDTVSASGDSNNILLEDVAVFGTGRKMITGSQGGNGLTCRRCWVRWEGSITGGPKQAISFHYNNTGFVCENCLGTWSGESMPESYYLTDVDGRPGSSYYSHFEVQDPYGIFSNDRAGVANARLLGSLAYIKTNDRYPSNAQSVIWLSGMSGFSLWHTAAVISASNSIFNSSRNFRLEACCGFTQTGASAYNITSIRGSVGDNINTSAWNVQNLSAGASLAAVANPWMTTGVGANLCMRWESGQATNTPLWPWPMNERIKQATASAGAYSGPCPTCVGGRFTRTATDVTADIESLLGPIASQCKSDSPPAPRLPVAPTNLSVNP